MTGNAWIAVAGILGTLAGTCLGAWISWRIHVRTLDAHEKARFHNQRLEAYAAFLGSANEAVGRFAFDGGHDVKAVGECIKSFELVRLLAGSDVNRLATVVHGTVAMVARGGKTDAERAELVARFNREVGVLVRGVRQELGVQVPE